MQRSHTPYPPERRRRSVRQQLWLLACLLPLLLLRPTAAQERAWSEPVFLSPGTTSSWFPDVVAGADGSVHVVWASSRSIGPELADTMDLLFYRALRDGAWTEPNDISNPGTGGFATRNSIVAGPGGDLSLLIRGQEDISFLRAPLPLAETFQAWSAPRKINNRNTPYYTGLALDPKGTLHALWVETVPDDPERPRKDCPSCADVFYRSSSDGGASWSSPVNISSSPEGSMKPQIQADDRGGLHVVWEEGVDTIVARGKPTAGVYRYSPDGGATWRPAVRFTLPTIPGAGEGGADKLDAPKQLTLGLAGGRTPVVVYRSSADDRMFFQTPADEGFTDWGEPQALPGVRARDLNDTPWDGYSMAADSAGNLHLVLVGFLNSERARVRPRLLHMIWGGQAWSAPTVAIGAENYPDWSNEGLKVCNPPPQQTPEEQSQPASECQRVQRYPEWPRAAIGEGNRLHLAWFTRNVKDRYTSDYAAYQIWYSSRLVDAPAIAPVPIAAPPTPAPPPTPTPLPMPTPVPTLPPESASAPTMTERMAWEAPGMLVAGLAVVPALGFLGLLVVIARLRARR
ncbi:MAG TPA: sialidase family protein [Roseiflexaceae bacterium]|nr:sialidase family protein [Roseiflexaceae bacterium]